MIVDLDHSKSVNDVDGHLCGDVVLREAARRLAASVRNYDTVGRYGGKEFLVVVPSTDGTGALALADRIHEAIGRSPVQTEAGPLGGTASCGVAVCGCERPLRPEALLHLAEEALYPGKGRGRNCSELAVPPEETFADTPPSVSDQIPVKP